jgi:hypothetical protein
MAILSIELFLAHKAGKSIEEIAAALGVPADVIALRIEAARFCVDYQLKMLA